MTAAAKKNEAMTDLEVTRLCAEAMGLDWRLPTNRPMLAHPESAIQYLTIDDSGDECVHNWRIYDPLHDRSQARGLVIALPLDVTHQLTAWEVKYWDSADMNYTVRELNESLLRAICLCAAEVQQAKQS